MRDGRRLGMLLLCVMGCVSIYCSAAAQENGAAEPSGLSWGFESDYNPRYVWRGLAWTEGPVSQTSLWTTLGGTTFSVWANSCLDSVDGRNTNEIDYSASWEGSWRGVNIEPSLQVWTYPHQTDSPTTVDADVRFTHSLGALSVFTTHSLDVHEYKGAYFGELGLGYEREIGENADLESSISLGWASSKFNEVYIGPARSALNLVSFDASVTWRMRGGAYIRPHLSITRLLNRDLREAVDEPSLTNLGVAAGIEF
jgi:hypothetical protein